MLIDNRNDAFGEAKTVAGFIRARKGSALPKSSPYSAAFTGCGFRLDETVAILPILQAPDAEARLQAEVEDNSLLLLGKAKTRSRNIVEIRRRYNAVPRAFWDWFSLLPAESQKCALFFVLLKTYHLLYDFQLNVVLPQGRSADQTLTKSNLMMRLHEIAVHDDFVDGWSDETKSRVCSGALSFLRDAGILERKTDALHPPQMGDGEFAHFITIGEGWFLEACLLQPFEISRIKEGLA